MCLLSQRVRVPLSLPWWANIFNAFFACNGCEGYIVCHVGLVDVCDYLCVGVSVWAISLW